MSEKQRKYRRVAVDPSQFLSIFREGLTAKQGFKIVKGLPEDTEVIGMMYDHNYHAIIFVVSSEDFPHVTTSDEIPFAQVDIQLDDFEEDEEYIPEDPEI
jgi:hypothetical protein